jgi:hypothetical protein
MTSSLLATLAQSKLALSSSRVCSPPPNPAGRLFKFGIQRIERIFLSFMTKVAIHCVPKCSVAVGFFIIIGIARIEVQQDNPSRLRVPNERLGDRFNIDLTLRFPPIVVPIDAVAVHVKDVRGLSGKLRPRVLHGKDCSCWRRRVEAEQSDDRAVGITSITLPRGGFFRRGRRLAGESAGHGFGPRACEFGRCRRKIAFA